MYTRDCCNYDRQVLLRLSTPETPYAKTLYPHMTENTRHSWINLEEKLVSVAQVTSTYLLEVWIIGSESLSSKSLSTWIRSPQVAFK